MVADQSIRDLDGQVERWKSIAEANDRSYCVARDALEMTRTRLAEMTGYRDNASKRLEWAERDLKAARDEIVRLKRELSAETRKRRALAKGKR